MTLAMLQQACADRLHWAGKAQGVVGLVGLGVPDEPVLASGRFPVQITAPRGGETPTADHYIDPVVAPEIRALFEAAVAGAYEFLDLLVISRPYAQLYYYLKEIYRLGRAPRLPPLFMYDVIQSRREAVRAYNVGCTERLVERLQRGAARPIDEPSLAEAVAITNRRRAAQRRLQALRWGGKVRGVDALTALAAARFMPPVDYVEALEAWLATIGQTPAQGPRVLVATAEPLSEVDLHAAVEAAGAVVVAEDDAWGARAAGDDIDTLGDLTEAITRKVWLDVATPAVNPYEDREAWFRAHALRSDVDAVVFYVPPSDRQFGWDYPRMAAFLEARGKPALLVREDASTPDGRAQIASRAGAFLKTAEMAG
jgi:benzoyl-CoA reductase/2-hydroxyglutaryl-CoA dehydratase subunit BcrC/BadD/HgdB